MLFVATEAANSQMLNLMLPETDRCCDPISAHAARVVRPDPLNRMGLSLYTYVLLQGCIPRQPLEVQSTSSTENLEARLSPKLLRFEDRAWRNGSFGCVGKVQKQQGPRSVGEGLALGSPNRIHPFWKLLGSSFITMSVRGGPFQFAQASGRHLGQSDAGPDGLWMLWGPSRLDPPGSSGVNLA